MEFFVGTSGWAYAWNETRRLDWFVEKSGLNAIELNASFYRYPAASTVENWAKKGKDLRWSIKVNRLFTHTYKFNAAALERWRRFQELFAPLDANVDFYLFQLPPKTTPHSASFIENFAKKTNLEARFALEVRNQQWFTKEWRNWAAEVGVTWVSVDAPDLPRDVFKIDSAVYVRMHGRIAWYVHRYTNQELEEVADKILDAKPKKAYVFFNNDATMLENARAMRLILKNKSSKQ